jgi:serine phosphatase RsbU (regulator of sigma subunit)
MAAQYGRDAICARAPASGLCETADIAEPAGRTRALPDGPVVATGSAVAVPDNPWGLVGGLFLLILIAVIDLLLGPGPQLNGLFTTPPFVTAVFSGTRRTAVVSAFSIALNIVMGSFGGDYTSSQGFRTGGVIVAAIGAVALSVLRQREQRHVLTLSRIAEVTQLAVLRTLPERVGPAEVAVRYVSASAQAHVGGDFYEAVHCGDSLRAIVGDIRGKGLEAVQLANVLVGAFRGADHDGAALVEVAGILDQAFVRFDPGDEDFATAVMVELRPDGTLIVVNCGHPPPLLLTAAAVSPIAPPSYVPPIGLHPRPGATERQLAPGDRLLLFTDGILESRHGGRFFDFEGNVPVVREGTPRQALDGLVDRLVDFTDGRVDDDVALLLAAYR